MKVMWTQIQKSQLKILKMQMTQIIKMKIRMMKLILVPDSEKPSKILKM